MKLKEALNGLLDENALNKLIKSYDVIGDIIVIRLLPGLESKRKLISEALHTIYPQVRTIAAVPLHSHTDERYRTRDLEVIWGDENLKTTYREHGCIFNADLKHTFLSPRLSYERMRIAQKVALDETIINMFAGVGCFSIIITRMQPWTIVYSIDVNPHAFEYMKENVRLNKVEGTVIPILGDAGEEVEKLAGVADRVLMPLPEQAHAFLPSAVRALRLNKGGAEERRGSQGVIHYYAVSTGGKDEELFNHPLEKAKDVITSAFGDALQIELVEKRIVRSVGPRKYHVVLDLRVTRML